MGPKSVPECNTLVAVTGKRKKHFERACRANLIFLPGIGGPRLALQKKNNLSEKNILHHVRCKRQNTMNQNSRCVSAESRPYITEVSFRHCFLFFSSCYLSPLLLFISPLLSSLHEHKPFCCTTEGCSGTGSYSGNRPLTIISPHGAGANNGRSPLQFPKSISAMITSQARALDGEAKKHKKTRRGADQERCKLSRHSSSGSKPAERFPF